MWLTPLTRMRRSLSCAPAPRDAVNNSFLRDQYHRLGGAALVMQADGHGKLRIAVQIVGWYRRAGR